MISALVPYFRMKAAEKALKINADPSGGPTVECIRVAREALKIITNP